MEGLTPRRRPRLDRFLALAASACVSTAAAAAPNPPAAPAGAKAPASPTASAAPTTPAATGEVGLTLLPSGAMPKLGGYRPQQVKLAKNKPAGVKKAPEMAEPLYGQIKFGTKQFAVALDEPKGGDAKLYVDSNGDGDLTDDPATTWDKKAAQGLTQYSASSRSNPERMPTKHHSFPSAHTGSTRTTRTARS